MKVASDFFQRYIEKHHRGGYIVRIYTDENRVEMYTDSDHMILFDNVYRYCPKCDGVRPLNQFTWRSMAGNHLRTQPYCERHSRRGRKN